MKNNLLNRIVALVAMTVVLVSSGLTTFAADPIMPRWSILAVCDNMFTKEYEYADYDIFGCGGATSVPSGYYAYVYVELQCLVNGSWRYYDSWEDSGYVSAIVEEYIEVTPGYSYQLLITHEARNANGVTLETFEDRAPNYLVSYARN